MPGRASGRVEPFDVSGVLLDLMTLLETGDLLAAYRILGRLELGGEQRVVQVVQTMRLVLTALIMRTTGDVEDAFGVLIQASNLLQGQDYVETSRRPVRAPGSTFLIWRLTNVIRREQIELGDLRSAWSTMRGQPELIHVCIDWLSFVEFAPWAANRGPEVQEMLGLDDPAFQRFGRLSRLDIHLRATKLRQFADVRRGTAAMRTWSRLGGEQNVRHAALLALGSMPRPTEWKTLDVPIREGRLLAWRSAKRIVESIPRKLTSLDS